MKKKILLLFILFPFVFFGYSCNYSRQLSILKKPPTDFFVKIYKELQITRCSKKPVALGRPACETKTFYSTGSGLAVKISGTHTVVLTAGHVCTTEGLREEDAQYKYSWTDTIRALDRNKLFHQSHVILSSPATDKSSDLCTLFVPSMKYFEKAPSTTIARRGPKIGEDVYYIGAPQGIYHPPTALIVRGVFSGEIDKFSSLISAPSAGGASGSVILSSNNQIFGVLFAVHPSFKYATVITNFAQTRKFLNETKRLLIEQK